MTKRVTESRGGAAQHIGAGVDWEDAFSNAAYIPGGMEFPAIWTERAARFRAVRDCQQDISYGDGPRHRLDLFRPDGRSCGLVVFVHGGFWLNFDKSSWSDLAAGPLARGWSVAIPSYTLAPDADLPRITAEAGEAICKAAEMVDGPICLAGHSAGGHLVARMACRSTPLPDQVAGRLARVVSISGLHDLRPLRLHSMNERLGLTPATAVAESPALCDPLAHVSVVAWVGAQERPEFLRQSALLVEAWRGKARAAVLVAEPGRHHFNVIDGLKETYHPLINALIGADT